MNQLTNERGRGVLFPRQVQGNQPNWRGGANIDGTEYEIAGWTRISKGGKEYVSLTVKPAQAPASASPAHGGNHDDNDIPF